MSDHDDTQPLGGPKPVSGSEGYKLLNAASAGVFIATGGLILFTTFMNVGRVRGATRSATLQWEERQAEIQAVIEADRENGPEKADDRTEGRHGDDLSPR